MAVFDNDQQRELYDAILWWQSIEIFYQIMCNNNSGHQPLEPTIAEDGSIAVFCKDCGFAQVLSHALAATILNSYSERAELDFINFSEDESL